MKFIGMISFYTVNTAAIQFFIHIRIQNHQDFPIEKNLSFFKKYTLSISVWKYVNEAYQLPYFNLLFSLSLDLHGACSFETYEY